MTDPVIRETPAEIVALERRNPQMASRLRWLRLLRTHPRIEVGSVADQLGVNEYEIERWAVLYFAGGINMLIDPRTVVNRQTAQTLTFSQHAENRMWDLFKSHANQLGRQLWIDFEACRNESSRKRDKYDCSLFQPYQDFDAAFRNWYRTDCQTYILDVIKFAYEKTGRRDIYKGLMGAFKREGTTGTVMAKYLVKNGWKAYLFMPDTDNPDERKRESYDHHVQMYRTASKSNKWWGVPLSGFIIDYKPTPDLRFNAKKLTPQDADGKRKFEALSNVGFSVCVFTEGLHTGLHSRGMIYEVHWDVLSEQTPNSNPHYSPFYQQQLFERKSLWDFGWKEGIIVVPPDVTANLN